MGTLTDKITQAAKTAIEQQENVPATVEEWRLIGINHGYPHQVTAAVSISTHTTSNHNFEVWLTVDIATEEIEYI